MKLVTRIVVYALLAGAVVFVVKKVSAGPCQSIVYYDIGSFDQRFGISRDTFIKRVALAEKPWEEAAGRELFQYRPGSDFKINLLWSPEQERLYEGNKVQEKLDDQEASLGGLENRYQSAVNHYDRERRTYEQKLQQYENDVHYWNEQGGAPPEEYRALENERIRLNDKVTEIKQLLAKVNRIAEENNQQVNNYNQEVDNYNEQYVGGEEFDAGNTDGHEINIYSYDGLQELRVLLIHEFGHVLGIEHVQDDHSVMYYLLNQSNKSGILSNYDIAALDKVCSL